MFGRLAAEIATGILGTKVTCLVNAQNTPWSGIPDFEFFVEEVGMRVITLVGEGKVRTTASW